MNSNKIFFRSIKCAETWRRTNAIAYQHIIPVCIAKKNRVNFTGAVVLKIN